MDILQISLHGVCFILRRNFCLQNTWGLLSALSDEARCRQEQSVGILESPFCHTFMGSSGWELAALAAKEAQLSKIQDFHTFHLGGDLMATQQRRSGSF